MKSILLLVAISALILNQAYKKKAAAVYFGEAPEGETEKSLSPEPYEAKFSQPTPFLFAKEPAPQQGNYSFEWSAASPSASAMQTDINADINKERNSPRLISRQY